MKHLLIITGILISLFVSAQIYDGRIVDIVCEGNYSASQEYIINKSLLSVGSGVNEESVQRAIRELYKTGIFKQIEIFLRDNEAGKIIVINVQEYPRIKSILIKGNKKKKDKDIRENISVSEGSFASTNNIYKLKNEVVVWVV